MMEKAELQSRIITIARSWTNTRYVSNAMVRGPGGGVDCAMLLVAVYCEAGIVPKEFDPRPYPPQWHMHRDQEKYLEFVKCFAREFSGPPGPADVVLFKIGRLFAHGAIVINWPIVIHARSPTPVREDNINMDIVGKHSLLHAERRFFSIWPEA